MSSKQMTMILAAFLVTASLTIVAGCSNDDNGTNTTAAGVPQVLAVYPADGATNVPTSTGVSLVFDQPMDTNSVRMAFHFSGGTAMEQWMDSLSHHMGMGGMMGGHYQDMDHMMTWMDSIEFPGHFEWNGTLDSCRYYPDSTLMPGTDYMTFMYGTIDGMGGGMRMMQNESPDSTMFRFTTAP